MRVVLKTFHKSDVVRSLESLFLLDPPSQTVQVTENKTKFKFKICHKKKNFIEFLLAKRIFDRSLSFLLLLENLAIPENAKILHKLIADGAMRLLM